MSDFKTAYELLKEKKEHNWLEEALKDGLPDIPENEKYRGMFVDVENEKEREGMLSQSLLLRRGVNSNLETSLEGNEQ